MLVLLIVPVASTLLWLALSTLLWCLLLRLLTLLGLALWWLGALLGWLLPLLLLLLSRWPLLHWLPVLRLVRPAEILLRCPLLAGLAMTTVRRGLTAFRGLDLAMRHARQRGCGWLVLLITMPVPVRGRLALLWRSGLRSMLLRD